VGDSCQLISVVVTWFGMGGSAICGGGLCRRAAPLLWRGGWGGRRPIEVGDSCQLISMVVTWLRILSGMEGASV
jgi:hypothetical protein